MELKGTVAIVTGGNGGLGQRVCHALARAGCNVAVVYARSRDQAQQVATEVQTLGVRAEAMACDVTDAAAAADIPNTTWLARALFTDFLLPFEVAAVILTIAVVAAVMLTLRRRSGVKHQNPAEQARVRSADRLRMVKMDAVRPAEPAATEESAK